ncbi:MAG: class I SAM-dependent methyltransferase [Deltaproteobacteria bacterium]|nr:MAG: class I SAM-dependent methyltransferase [Deltaproteobacteria bacterium]
MSSRISSTDAPHQLALPAALSQRLEQLFVEAPPDPAQLVRVKQLGDAHQPIDHDVDGIAFAYLYFGANFAKTYLATDLAPRGHAISLLDLGAGSGASICGLVQRCHDEGIRIGELAIVDRSEPQLALFRRVALPWLRALYPHLRLVTAGADAIDWLSADRTHWDVIAASYLFCELGPAQRPALETLLARRLREGTRCLVVDSLGRRSPLRPRRPARRAAALLDRGRRGAARRRRHPPDLGQEPVGRSARENAYTRLAVGCYADGRRDRACRRTTDACADGPWYVRGHDLPILVTVAAPDPIRSRSPPASSR